MNLVPNKFWFIVNANSYRGIPKTDHQIWEQGRGFYEFISRFKNVPILGEGAFALFDRFQEIEPFYPKRDLSRSNMQTKSTYSLIKNKGWLKHLVNHLAKKPYPLVCSFFSPAQSAEFFNYPGEIYLMVCDTDVSRAWVALEPNLSRINYLAPTARVVERLRLYGVPKERIIYTGFPLPAELVGVGDKIAKKNLAERLVNLDPSGIYQSQYGEEIKKQLGKLPAKSKHPLTITFAIGGAGAQKEIAVNLTEALAADLSQGKLRLNLIAGIHNEVASYFKKEIRRLKLWGQLGKNIVIVSALNKQEYFKKFNKVLETTDILWSKPSELSFYVALGLPFIITEPIGSQENFNEAWLTGLGAGRRQGQLKQAREWLFDLLQSGWLAEAAMQGFIEGERHGTEHIVRAVCSSQLGNKKLCFSSNHSCLTL
ncbi:MAG: hypothetical protein NTV81_04020 [Candidatus Komeilibacteria bacterium]|nr:hypothetical protein [Candidatus Komeilibacteria bacterium]